MSRARQQLILFAFGFALSLCMTIAILFFFLRAHGVNLFHPMPVNAPAAIVEISRKPVVVANSDIPAGMLITTDMLKLEERSITELPLSVLMDADAAVGRYAAARISSNMMLTDTLVSQTSTAYEGVDRLCDYEIPGYLVNNLIEPGTCVDLQLIRTAGDTYTVLAKKNVRYTAENRVVLAVSFEEMDLANRAFAEQNAGMGRIMAVRYMDTEQIASTVNYVPATEISVMTTQPLAENAPMPAAVSTAESISDQEEHSDSSKNEPLDSSISEGITAVVPDISPATPVPPVTPASPASPAPPAQTGGVR